MLGYDAVDIKGLRIDTTALERLKIGRHDKRFPHNGCAPRRGDHTRRSQSHKRPEHHPYRGGLLVESRCREAAAKYAQAEAKEERTVRSAPL